jgi:acyl carrier protein
MRIEDKIRYFILDELQAGNPHTDLTDDFPLLEKEVIDSMGIFQLVGFIEEEFGVQVGDEDLVPEHFASISAIGGFVASRGAS